MNRYDRQIKIIGAEGQRRLEAARILAFGAGGLAATALPWLAAAGIGELTIVDPDTVAASNLHRQIPFTDEDIGDPKAEVMARFCNQRGCRTRAITHKLNPREVLREMRRADLVLDCSDSRPLAELLNDAALVCQTPVLFGNASGRAGQLFALKPQEGLPCWRCLWPQEVASGGNCNALGVLGPVPATIGAMMAQWALDYLACAQLPLGICLCLDFATLDVQRLRVAQNPHCVHQLSLSAFLEQHMNHYLYEHSIDQAQDEGMIIVDIRRNEEIDARPLPQADFLVEMMQLLADPERYLDPQQRYLLVCASGIRTQSTAADLWARGYRNVFAYPNAW